MSTISFQSSQVTSTAGLRMLQPALFTRMSIRPNSRSASATARWMLACSRTSSSTQATLRPERLELVGERFERRGGAAGDDEIGTGLGQHAGKVLPQAAARAGHHRHAVGQDRTVQLMRFRSTVRYD